MAKCNIQITGAAVLLHHNMPLKMKCCGGTEMLIFFRHVLVSCKTQQKSLYQIQTFFSDNKMPLI